MNLFNNEKKFCFMNIDEIIVIIKWYCCLLGRLLYLVFVLLYLVFCIVGIVVLVN